MVMISSKYEILKFRLMVVEWLRLLKRMYSYRELASMTGIPETVLCRYVKGSIIPSLDQAEKLWKSLNDVLDVRSLVRDKIEVRENGVVNTSEMLSDPYMLRLIAHYAYQRFAGRRVTKVLTPEVNGIPLATSIALTLQVPLIVAKRSLDASVDEYYDDSFVQSPVSVVTFYVPRSMLKRRDEVLIVDDVMRTGKTVRSLINIVNKARASLSGVLVLVAVGDEWKSKLDLGDVPIEVVVNVPFTRER